VLTSLLKFSKQFTLLETKPRTLPSRRISEGIYFCHAVLTGFYIQFYIMQIDYLVREVFIFTGSSGGKTLCYFTQIIEVLQLKTESPCSQKPEARAKRKRCNFPSFQI